MDNQRQIIENGIEILNQTTGLKLTQNEQRTPTANINLTLKTKELRQKYTAVFQRTLNNNHTLGVTLNAMRDLPHKGLVVAEYITPPIAVRLQEMDIPFFDATGNAFFNEPPVYIFITGNKLKRKTNERQPKPFHAAALRVVFPLLCRSDLIRQTLRTLAGHTNVALGTVVNVMNELQVRKHLVTDEGTLRLVNLKQLLEQWLILYPTVLRPKLWIGRYTAQKESWWADAQLPKGAVWGGEVAAERITKYLKPETITIYAQENVPHLLIKNRLKEDPNGKIEILKTFWDLDLHLGDNGIAPALLVYTDLLATGDPRNVETAKLIYEQKLDRHFKEN